MCAAALGLMAVLGARYPPVIGTGGELWQALDVPLAIPTTSMLGSTARAAGGPADAEEVAAAVRRYLANPS